MPEKMNFYADFYKAGLSLQERDRQAFYAAVLDYFFGGVEPDLKGAVAGMFELVRGRLDLSAKNSESGRKGGANSIGKRKRGGASSAAPSGAASEPADDGAGDGENGASSAAPSGAVDSSGGEGEGEGEGEKTFSKSEKVFGAREAERGLDPLGEPRRGPSYAPPAPAEVAAYVAASGGFPIDAERFCGWYGDHGWPADDWRGTAMSWSRDERDRAAKRPREVSADDFAEYR